MDLQDLLSLAKDLPPAGSLELYQLLNEKECADERRRWDQAFADTIQKSTHKRNTLITMTDTFRALCAELTFCWGGTTNPYDFAENAAPIIGRMKAALAQPEPEGPSDDELYELWNSEGTDADFQECRRFARAVLTRWGRPAIEPVPVAERPWEREGWCDTDGRCWWGRPSEELCNSDWFLATRAEVEEFCDCSPPVVSLPHHALPVPTTRRDHH